MDNRGTDAPRWSRSSQIRSALLIDFDNIYIGLKQIDSRAAEQFVTNPLRWVDWLLLQGIEDPDYDSFYRRIIVKRCYLNPDSFAFARPYFVRSGFQTIDCPPLTRGGKTSADIHMVIDVLDLLSNETRVDEFVVMSTDADFTPLLRRISSRDRRSIVLALGPASAAYKASCDLLLDQKEFVQAVLGVDEADDHSDTATRSVPLPAATAPAATARPPVPPARAHPEGGPSVQEVIAAVRDMVRNSKEPVTMARVVSSLRRDFGDSVLRLWSPPMKFKDFLAGVPDRGFDISGVMPGYVFDPGRHQLSRTEDDAIIQDPDIAKLAQRVHTLTDTPMLTPEHYSLLLSRIAAEVNANGFHIVGTPKAVREACAAADHATAKRCIDDVIRGITYTGHRFGKGHESSEQLAVLLRQNILNLCRDAGSSLSNAEETTLARWINAGENPADR